MNLVFISCKKNNEDAKIKLKGNQYDTIFCRSFAFDPGATANNFLGKDISNKIESDWAQIVNMNAVGNYKVTYKINTLLSKESSVERFVFVKMNGNSYVGKYLGEWKDYFTNITGVDTIEITSKDSRSFCFGINGDNIPIDNDSGITFYNHQSDGIYFTRTIKGSIDNFASIIKYTSSGINIVPYPPVNYRKDYILHRINN
jgi:hypothetical protein